MYNIPWAKTVKNKLTSCNIFYPLVNHLVDAYAVSFSFLKNTKDEYRKNILIDEVKKMYTKKSGELTNDDYINILSYVTGLHDIGKLIPFFSWKIDDKNLSKEIRDKIEVVF